MPRQLTFSFTFMSVIWFRSLYLPRPIISDYSKFRRVPACLLKLCISCSANFKLSPSFVNSIMSSAYCKVLNSILLSQSNHDLTFNPWIKLFCLSRIESISMATINKSALTGQPCFTERVTEMCSVNHPLFFMSILGSAYSVLIHLIKNFVQNLTCLWIHI